MKRWLLGPAAILFVGLLFIGSKELFSQRCDRGQGSLVGVFLFFVVSACQMSRGYELVAPSMTREEVLEVLGEPTRETDGTVSVFGDNKVEAELTKGCVSEVWYFSRVSPQRWAYCFDTEGVLVDKQYFAL